MGMDGAKKSCEQVGMKVSSTSIITVRAKEGYGTSQFAKLRAE